MTSFVNRPKHQNKSDLMRYFYLISTIFSHFKKKNPKWETFKCTQNELEKSNLEFLDTPHSQTHLFHLPHPSKTHFPEHSTNINEPKIQFFKSFLRNLPSAIYGFAPLTRRSSHRRKSKRKNEKLWQGHWCLCFPPKLGESHRIKMETKP